MLHPYRFLLVIALIANAVNGYAQARISITGKIVDKEFKPIPSVYVVAIDKNALQFADISSDDGSFSISLKAGHYIVSGTYFGTVLFEKKIEVNTDEDMGTITATPSISIQEVVVSGNRPLLKQIDDKLVFDVQNLSNIARYKVDDVLNMFQGLRSIQTEYCPLEVSRRLYL